MPCSHFSAVEVAEWYLRRELDEPAACAFEMHYFECETYFAELRELRQLRAGLLSRQDSARDRTERRSAIPWPALFAAFGLVLAAAADWFLLRNPGNRSPRPDRTMAELARVEPPHT